MPTKRVTDQQAFMRAKDAAAYLGISISSWHRKVKEGLFPQPMSLGHAKLWDTQEVLQIARDIRMGTFANPERSCEHLKQTTK